MAEAGHSASHAPQLMQSSVMWYAINLSPQYIMLSFSKNLLYSITNKSILKYFLAH